MLNNLKQWLGFEARGLLRRVPHPKDLHWSELLLGEYKRKNDFKLLAPLFPENQYGLSVCSFEAGANENGVYWGSPIGVRWLVAKARQMGWCNARGEAQLKAFADVSRKFGVVFEKDLPSDETMAFNDFVNIDFSKFDTLASKNKVGSYYWLDTPSEIYQALDQGYAVVVGRYWANKFDAGWVLNPTRNSNSAHATVIVGYRGDLFIELNSYGTSWGDKGFFYTPKDQLYEDIDSFGAIAITPIPYTPKQIKIKTWTQQLLALKDKLKNMFTASEYLYATAKGLLGQNLAKGNEYLGCAQSMSYIINKAFDEDIHITGTGAFLDYLNKSPKWEKIEEPEPKCVIISPTSEIPAGSPLKNGHVGIVGKLICKDDNDNSLYIMSNDSDLGYWNTQWTLKKWQDYYQTYGRIPTYYYRRLIV